MARQKDSKQDPSLDYPLSPVPESARLPWWRIVNITLGVTGAMVFLQVPGELALEFGVINALIGVIYAALATAVMAIILTVFATRTGLNTGLLTRASGYGHRGASISQLCYAVNFVILGAIEGSIMAQALHSVMSVIPLWFWMSTLIVINIGINIYGIRLLDRFQRYSLPLYLILLALTLILAWREPAQSLAPEMASQIWTHFDLWKTLACGGALNGIVALQALLTADYARFNSRASPRYSQFLIGSVAQVGSFLVMGSIGIWLAVRFGNANTGQYLVALMGVWGAFYTILSQLRINLINIYSGSLSLSGFSSSVFGIRGGLSLWVLVTGGVVLAAMLLNIIAHAASVLTVLGCVMFAWIASLLADLLIARKWRHYGEDTFEYREERLPAWNATGVIALLTGALCGLVSVFSDVAILNALASLIAAFVAFISHLILARIECHRNSGW